MHLPENMCNCMQHSIYNVQQPNVNLERLVVEEKKCMLLCRSVFSDQPKTHACLHVREARSVSACREGEGACANCMYVCEGKGSRGEEGRWSWRAARWRLQGQLRDRPLSGHPQHPSTSCLSMSSMGPRSMGLSTGSTPYNASSTLLRKGFYSHEERTDKSQQTESPSRSRVRSRAQKPGVKWCRDFIYLYYQVLSLMHRHSQRTETERK